MLKITRSAVSLLPASQQFAMHFHDPIQRVVDPLNYLKYKMKVIDNARESYENASSQFSLQAPLVTRLGIPVKFETWFSWTLMHLWIQNCKTRTMGKFGADYHQEIFNHIWYLSLDLRLDVEMKLHQAKIKSSINKITADLLESYYGAMLSYDEGLYNGGPTLASALWRNVLYSRTDVSAQQIEMLLEYTVKELNHMDKNTFDAELRFTNVATQI